MNIYLAAKYSRRDEMMDYAQEAVRAGHVVTSRWLHETTPLNVKHYELPEEFNRNVAMTDLSDINDADTFVFFSEDADIQPPRGGRHVEFGYAYAMEKIMVVIGEKENIFHHLPDIAHYESWEAYRRGL